MQKQDPKANDNVVKSNKPSSSTDMMVDLMASLIEYRGADDLQHVNRIRLYTETLLKSIYKSNNEKYKLTKNDIEVYAKASTLHDIGKIAIPDEILLKKGRLSPKERETMKLHSIRGAEIVGNLKGIFEENYVSACFNICKYHHERWDGSGYPDKLVGEQIPFIARIVAIADVYDALTSVKLYKPSLPHKTAVEMITNGDCGMFDPEILDSFKAVKNKFEKISLAHLGSAKKI